MADKKNGTQDQPAAGPILTRSDDREDVYANNIQFEWSIWDLKLLLGVLDQTGGKLTIDQHTAVHLPWMQVKLMIYYLQINLHVYEAQNGKLKLPPDLLPPVPDPLPSELKDNPMANTTREFVLKLREEFVNANNA